MANENKLVVKSDSAGWYVVVVSGNTLSGIAAYFKGKKVGNVEKFNKTYKQLQTLNNIANANLIYVKQKIYLEKTSSSSSTKTATTIKPKVTNFGEQSDAGNTLFATWEWDKHSTTEKYLALWEYSSGDSVWFKGSDDEITVGTTQPSHLYKQSLYSIPSNAIKVRFRVKPFAKGTTKNNKTTYPWTNATWSETKTWTKDKYRELAETKPDAPTAVLNKDDKTRLIASVDEVQDLIDKGATHIEFMLKEPVKNTGGATTSSKEIARGTAKINTGQASYSFKLDNGKTYIVFCRAYSSSSKTYSEWSTDPSEEVQSLPAVPSGFKIKTAILDEETNEYNVILTWKAVTSADAYEIQYATRKDLFDISDKVTSAADIKGETKLIYFDKDSAGEYFFRIRAKNGSDGYGEWSSIISVILGTSPAPPTTWSSTTTVKKGETVTLYWVHNTEDGSNQTKARLSYNVNGAENYTGVDLTAETTIDKITDPYIKSFHFAEGDADDQTSHIVFNCSDAGKIKWTIRTAGVSGDLGEFSITRTVNVYAEPTLSVTLEKKVDGEYVDIDDTIEEYPFYINATAGTSDSNYTQRPIGYHITIYPNESYETVDHFGNNKIVNKGEELYSSYFDTKTSPFRKTLNATNIDLENGIEYTAKCVVTMNSGLSKEATRIFTVNWADTLYLPDAEITFNENTYTTSIRPYCERTEIKFHQVTKVSSKIYRDTGTEIGAVYGEEVLNAKTEGEGLQVYSGTTASGDDVYYCMVEESVSKTDAKLSVYRREFDGSFTEIATGLSSAKRTTVTDPHPSLDYARYRIVATDNDTGAVSYSDIPGLPIHCHSVIIQWAEQWNEFDTAENEELVQPPWSGSLLKLPYNIDVSENTELDVETIEYIGRSSPVTYYGTQVSQTASLSVEIEKDDVDTIYALRRLSRWIGDVYVREPSGIGYWAIITVSFSQKHDSLTIPVSLSITRVEGGM
jgi:hypothetical protein